MPHPRISKDLFGHDDIQNNFIALANKGVLHHAWLLSGPKGVGKATFAYMAAKFLLTNKWDNLESFSTSSDAQVAAKVNSQSHPDLFVLEAEEENRSFETIKVDAVRELASFCNLTTASSKHKVVIIDSVNDLNVNSANALLKALEEPHPDTFFLLVCHNLGSVLPTIKSRCRNARFKPLSKQDFNKVLEAQNLQDLTDLYENSRGSISTAQIMSEEVFLKIYEHLYEIFADKVADKKNILASIKLSDDKIWNVFSQLFEMAMHRLAIHEQELYIKLVDKLYAIKELYTSAERFHLDRHQTSILIINGLHELHF